MRTPRPTRHHRALGVVGAVLAAGSLAACGSSGSGTAAGTTATTGPPTATTVPTTAAGTTVPTLPPTTVAPTTAAPTTVTPTTAPPTTAPATTAPPATAPPATSVVGLTLTGAGNTFTAPASPTTVAYNPACNSLFDPGYTGECVIVASPSGTIAALVEVPQQANGGAPAAGSERDLVYREVGNTWSLVLRRTPVSVGSYEETKVYESDIMRDGDPKAVFVEPSANPQYANEIDVVEASGVVTLYRQMHGGFATVPASGGLDTYVPDPAGGYDEATIAYTNGAWTITAASQVSQSQAQSLDSQAFYDPEAPAVYNGN
jgi:hypothetical protein